MYLTTTMARSSLERDEPNRPHTHDEEESPQLRAHHHHQQHRHFQDSMGMHGGRGAASSSTGQEGGGASFHDSAAVGGGGAVGIRGQEEKANPRSTLAFPETTTTTTEPSPVSEIRGHHYQQPPQQLQPPSQHHTGGGYTGTEGAMTGGGNRVPITTEGQIPGGPSMSYNNQVQGPSAQSRSEHHQRVPSRDVMIVGGQDDSSRSNKRRRIGDGEVESGAGAGSESGARGGNEAVASDFHRQQQHSQQYHQHDSAGSSGGAGSLSNGQQYHPQHQGFGSAAANGGGGVAHPHAYLGQSNAGGQHNAFASMLGHHPAAQANAAAMAAGAGMFGPPGAQAAAAAAAAAGMQRYYPSGAAAAALMAGGVPPTSPMDPRAHQAAAAAAAFMQPNFAWAATAANPFLMSQAMALNFHAGMPGAAAAAAAAAAAQGGMMMPGGVPTPAITSSGSSSAIPPRRLVPDQGVERGITGRHPVSLYMECDAESLSAYQCLVRKQIEIFEAVREDVETNAQGRNRPIVLGQVGIRCRHCATLQPKQRGRGAVYYPARLNGLYQAAQNMAVSHLAEHCHHVPDDIRDELKKLRERKSSAGGGKKYWAEGVRVLGVFEDQDGLRFEER